MTIEIDEVETEISVEFTNQFGEIEIDLITDVNTGNAIAPDLLDKHTSDIIYDELHEVVADSKEDIELENTYRLSY